MQYLVAATVATYTPGTSISYSGGTNFAEAVSASLQWQRADGHFYGDDVELDSDNGVLGYTISFEPSGLTDSIRNKLLGELVATNEYTITDAASPDVGFGYIRVMRLKGTSTVSMSYEGWWFYKVKFGVSSEETRTKEQSIEWRVPTLEGVGAGISLDNTGALCFAQHKTFSSLADAKSWLNSKAGIT
jgi:phi13 family phage major tail protein